MRCLALAACLHLAALPQARAQEPPSAAGLAGASARVPPGGAAAAAFDITVHAPERVRELLEKHLELQRFRAVADLDDNELARLLVAAAQNVRDLVGTLGYFSAEVTITQGNTVGDKKSVVVTVEPGAPTRAASVVINFSGDIATSSDAGAQAQRADIQARWQLPEGQLFTQQMWDSSKAQALQALTTRRYPAGKLADSLADIEPTSAQAKLSLRLDSGPLYRLGPLKVTGVARYDPVLVPRLTRLRVGDEYDQKQLSDAQQRLSASGYFDAAYVFLDPDGAPAAAPVQVQVREAPLKKVILGVGVSTDSGPRGLLEYTHLRVPGIGWRAANKVQADRKTPFAQTEWTSIVDQRDWRWVALARVERLKDTDLTTQAAKLRFGRTKVGDRIDQSLFLQYDRAQVQGAGLLFNAAAQAGGGSAFTANYSWSGRYFDSLPFPDKGYGLGAEVGGGTTLSTAENAQRQRFARVVGRWFGVQPLAGGRLAMRAETGAVLAKNSNGIPSLQLFRAGGDSSVRGYGFRDIGITLPNGVTGPGRLLAVGSVEWQRPLIRNGLPSEFENTFFIDAGAVGDAVRGLKPAAGIGTGVRWRSPIGPLQIDLAYGVKVQRVRLHVSVGFLF